MKPGSNHLHTSESRPVCACGVHNAHKCKPRDEPSYQIQQEGIRSFSIPRLGVTKGSQTKTLGNAVGRFCGVVDIIGLEATFPPPICSFTKRVEVSKLARKSG